jgi:hypothetical protein
MSQYVEEAGVFFKPLVEGMVMEGSYTMKDPCYDANDVNPSSIGCLRGSPWVTEAQKIMGGDIGEVSLETFDNFHRAIVDTPSKHLPYLNNTCPSGGKCALKGITMSETLYNSFSKDLGITPIAATEHRAKIKSR